MDNKFLGTQELADYLLTNSKASKFAVNGKVIAYDVKFDSKVLRVYDNGSACNINHDKEYYISDDGKYGTYKHHYMRISGKTKTCIYRQVLVGLLFNRDGYDALLKDVENKIRVAEEGVVCNHITSNTLINGAKYLEWLYGKDNLKHGTVIRRLEKVTGYTYWIGWYDIKEYEDTTGIIISSIDISNRKNKDEYNKLREYLNDRGMTAVKVD